MKQSVFCIILNPIINYPRGSAPRVVDYYKQTEMSDEEKTEVEDQLKGFEKLGNRFDHRFFDLKPEPYGYASWPKEYQFIVKLL